MWTSVASMFHNKDLCFQNERTLQWHPQKWLHRQRRENLKWRGWYFLRLLPFSLLIPRQAQRIAWEGCVFHNILFPDGEIWKSRDGAEKERCQAEKETDSCLKPASVREERLTSKSLYLPPAPCNTIISMLTASPSKTGPTNTFKSENAWWETVNIISINF